MLFNHIVIRDKKYKIYEEANGKKALVQGACKGGDTKETLYDNKFVEHEWDKYTIALGCYTNYENVRY